MRANYTQRVNGEWFAVNRRGYIIRCCDCGLVHSLDFRINGRRIEMRANREERRTAASRRGGGAHQGGAG